MVNSKITKNLSDADMFKNYKEEITFEHTDESEPEPKPAKRSGTAAKQEDIKTAFFTPQLQEQVGKALLELKLELYKAGIVDYTVKVSREGRKILLTAVEVPVKGKK